MFLGVIYFLNGKSMEQMKEQLRLHGLKATPARLEVLHVLSQEKKPLSIKALLSRVDASINQATLYRIVLKLKEVGMIAQVMLEHNHAHYYLVTEKDTHHIVCTQCHTIASFHGCTFTDMESTLLRSIPNFASIQSHTLELTGLCTSCEQDL